MGRLRFRLIVGGLFIALIVANLLVVFLVGPSLSDVGEKDTREREWEDDPSITEEPEVIEDVQGPVPDDEPKS